MIYFFKVIEIRSELLECRRSNKSQSLWRYMRKWRES